MSEKLENPLAFPSVAGTPSDSWGFQNDGMTLRDYFAAAALQGILASPCPLDGSMEMRPMPAATAAYRYANAMLAARVTD